MADPSVNRQLFFDFDDEYTEDDLQRDLKKTQILPFTQIGTPSPYRPPAKSRVVRNSGPSEAAKSGFQVRPVQFKSQAPVTAAEEVPSGLKTPQSANQTWNRPKPAGSLPAPQFGSSQFAQVPKPSVPTAQTPTQAATPADETKKIVSAQKASVKVVPSRYMQQLAKIESTAKSVKKSAANAQRQPLGQVDSNSTSVDTRRATIAPSKKPASKPVAATNAMNRTSVGPVATSQKQHLRASSVSGLSTSSQVPNSTQNASQISQSAALSHSGSVESVNKQTAANVPFNPSTQSDLRAALLQRREQKAAAAAAAAASKQAAATKARQSVGPATSSARPSIRSSFRDVPAASTTLQPSSNKTPGRGLVRQQSANLDHFSRSIGDSSLKIVPNRHFNALPQAEDLEDAEGIDNGQSFEESVCEAPAPSQTPRTLKKSFSTSSIKKTSTTAKKAAVPAKKSGFEEKPKNDVTAQQIAVMSSKIAQTISRDSSTASIPAQTTKASSKGKGQTLAGAQLETQIMQSQLLQWLFVNHRLEQARAAKRAASTHMIVSVLKKIEEMRLESDEVERELSARQAKVYHAELEQFKIACVQPIMHRLGDFLEKYDDTSNHLARDTHKMPSLGVASPDLHALLYTMQESQQLLNKMQSEFSAEYQDWSSTGQAIHELTNVVREETHEIRSYSEMLQALSSLGNQQASLIVHKLHLQAANATHM